MKLVNKQTLTTLIIKTPTVDYSTSKWMNTDSPFGAQAYVLGSVQFICGFIFNFDKQKVKSDNLLEFKPVFSVPGAKSRSSH